MRVAFVAEVFVPKWSLGAGAPFIAFRIFVKPAVCAMRHVPREPGAGPNSSEGQDQTATCTGCRVQRWEVRLRSRKRSL